MAQKLNIDIVARDRSKQALGKLQGSLGRLKQSVFNLRNAFIGLGAGLVIRNIVNTGKQIENLQVQLKFLFGSAQEGAKAFDEMAKFASKVPFSLEEIQAGSGVLAVVSDDAKELANLMKITGNVAAVTGLDFRTTAEQIQRSMSAGISAADLFRDRGVKSMLGFKAGATVSVEETAASIIKIYEIKIENLGSVKVQLINRTWSITDADGQTQIVKGPGVVGEQPIIQPGESFQYTSGTPLTTPSGLMVGVYGMADSQGIKFDVNVPAFSLDSPHQTVKLN